MTEQRPVKKSKISGQKKSVKVSGVSEWFPIKTALDQVHEAAFLVQLINLAILDANQSGVDISGVYPVLASGNHPG